MKISKYALSTSLAIAGLVISSNAAALPGFYEPAPANSVQVCVAQIGEQANYEDAGRVLHEVDSEERRVSGHTIRIDTTVFNQNGDEVIREYATICAISDDEETKRFTIRQKRL